MSPKQKRPSWDQQVGASQHEGNWTLLDNQNWTVAYRIIPKQGRLVIAEMRVYPSEIDPRHGEWSAQAESVPDGGLTTRFLRSITTSSATSPRTALAKKRDSMRQAVQTLGPGAAALHVMISGRQWLDIWMNLIEKGSKRPARPSHQHGDDRIRWLSIVAAAYVGALDRNNPNEVVAKELKKTPSGAKLTADKVRDYVRAARQVDPPLLTETMQGRGGGELTAQAQAVLKQIDKESKRLIPPVGQGIPPVRKRKTASKRKGKK